MMLNPTKKELILREEIAHCTDENKKKRLEKQLFDLEEKRFKQIADSPFC